MGFLVKAAKSVAKAVFGVVKGVFKAIGMVLGFVKPKGNAKNDATDKRLSKRLEPEDFRKIIFGKTAMAVDLRYWEVYGSKYEQFAEVLAAAGHEIEGYDEFYIEDELVPFSGTAATGTYAGVLSRQVKTGASGAALAVGSGSYWNSTSKFTGTAHYALAWNAGDQKKLPNGIPSRYTQVGRGARVYDPRRDSTRGGSGTHRVDDQTTWSYSTLDGNGQPIGRNNALQMLWQLIGWRITNPQTSEKVLVCGRGIDPNDINWPDFIAAANDAEALGLYTDMILSTGDDHEQNESIISADGLCGELLDPGGLWTYKIVRDDTASIAVNLTEDDILQGDVNWNPQTRLSELFNEVAGTYIDPSVTSLYQAKVYPTVKDAAYVTADGYRKRTSHNFQNVQDPALAQKLARIKLNRTRFTGEFSATFSFNALKATVWSIITLSSDRWGMTNKLFRVMSQSVSDEGIEMVLREEHPSIYAGGTVTVPAAPSSMPKYDIRRKVALTTFAGFAVTANGTGTSKQTGIRAAWDALPGTVRRVEVEYKASVSSTWASAGVAGPDSLGITMLPLLNQTLYDVRARAVTIHEVPGDWQSIQVTTTSAAIDVNELVGLGALAILNSVDLSNTGLTAGLLPATRATPQLVNGNLSMAANGALLGGGGGQVTLPGLGAGDLATKNEGSLALGAAQSWQKVNFGGLSITGSKISKTSGTGWGNMARGPILQDSGFMQARLKIQTGGVVCRAFIGFTNDPDRASGNGGDAFASAGVYSNSTDSRATIYAPSGILTNINDASINDVWSFFYRNGKVALYRNSTLIYDQAYTFPSGVFAAGFAAYDYLSTPEAYDMRTGPYDARMEAAVIGMATNGKLVANINDLDLIAESTTRKHAGESGATVGGTWAVNITGRPTNLASLVGGEGINNASLSIAANGSLLGGGGGQVTPRGIGVVGDLNATAGDTAIPNALLITDTYGWTLSNLTRAAPANGMRNYHFQKASGVVSGSSGFNVTPLPAGAAGKAYLSLQYYMSAGQQTQTIIQWYNAAVGYLGQFVCNTFTGGLNEVEFIGDIPAGAAYYTFVTGLYEQGTPGVMRIGSFRLAFTQKNATLGSAWGLDLTGRPTNLAALAGGEGINNAGLSIAANGTFLGGGGGQVTFAGIDTSNVLGRTSKMATTGRVSDPTAYNTQALLGPRNTTTLSPTYTVGGSNVTVNLPAHTRKIAGSSGPITLSYGAMSGVVAFSTYWVAYVDDPNLTGFASPSAVFSSDPDTLLYPGRYQIASGITPASNGTGGGTGGGGGGDPIVGCVAFYSWVEVQDIGFVPDREGVVVEARQYVRASKVVTGDKIRVLAEDCHATAWATVTGNKLVGQDGYRVSADGCEVDLSGTTPMTLKDGSTVLAPDVGGREVPIDNGQDTATWKTCNVEPIGPLLVAHISCSHGTYLAGNLPGRGIYSHNAYNKP